MTISSSVKDMLVQFLTDGSDNSAGFKAYFHYIPFEPKCTNWLNIAQQLKSPESPTIDCSWVITAPTIDSTITINFDTFEVSSI